MVILIDNYDSFVYNLARYITQLGFVTKVVRNDQISLNSILALVPSHIILSPGPCTPDKAGICLDLISALATKIPILGICLGHQAIGQAFGAKIVRANFPMHGVDSEITHNKQGILSNLPSPFQAARYHSLIISHKTIPKVLEVTAWSPEREVMAVQHRELPLYGVQFHPESILTEYGYQLLANFLNSSILPASSSKSSQSLNLRIHNGLDFFPNLLL